MTLKRPGRATRFKVFSVEKEANRIISPIRRSHAWFRGWRDGKRTLNGSSADAGFLERCYFLRGRKSYSDSLQDKCTNSLKSLAIELEAYSTLVESRLQALDGEMTEVIKKAAGIDCDTPTLKPPVYVAFIIVFFLAEFAFSYLNLSYSEMGGGLLVEAVLSLVAALFLVGFAHAIGVRYRKLPLALTSDRKSTYKIYGEIGILILFLIAMVLGLTALRARGLKARDNSSDYIVEASLFALGVAFSAFAAWLSGQTEYSGPKYGYRELEIKRARLTNEARAVRAQFDKVRDTIKSIPSTFTKRIDRINAINVDRYRQNERTAA